MPRVKHNDSKLEIFRTLDTSTGEITESTQEVQKSYTVNVPTEEFFQVYITLIARIYELNYADDIKLLIKFCEIAGFNTGKILLPAPERRVVCEQLKMQTSNMSKAIRRLKDKKLIDGEHGSYTINPAIFWKGEQRVRMQLLKDGSMSVIFNFKAE